MMASPLSPLPSAALNIGTPATARRVAQANMEDGSSPTPYVPAAEAADASANQSSPFVSEVQDKTADSPSKEDPSPSKIRHSRILSGNEIAPLTLLSPRDENLDPEPRSLSRQDSRSKSPRRPRFPIRPTGSSSPAKNLDIEKLPELSPERPPQKSLEEESPEKSSPVKAPEMSRENSLEKHMVKTQEMTLEDALRANEGLKKAIQIFEDESTMMENDDLPDINAMDVDHPNGMDDSIAGPDESMVSTFSTFSAIPNMTMFAKIGHSPTRFANAELTPAAAARARPDPSPARSARALDGGNTTSLLEFSDHLSRNGTFSSSKRARLSPAKTTGHRPSATPQRHPGNLLDFDIPPLPTPRSVPTVTAREVETLKSQFLSEISSLKASLLGKEAEASSLKTAVTDAEKRVGETSEQLRELKAEKETLLDDKQTWEKRCQEMEDVLRRVKAEIHHGQRERQELESKLDESEKRREAAEIMAQEAESKIAGMRAGRVSPDAGADNKSPGKDSKNTSSREVEIAVERVARELHALYKSKHEKKVTALKKSYANHWEKRVQALEVKIQEADAENEKLKQTQETAVTRVDPNLASENQELRTQTVQQSGQITELKAEVKQLGAVIESVKQDNTELIQLLERERVEKGELVSLAEEMMSMQHSLIQQEEKPAPPSARKVPEPVSARKSLARPMASGLRAPGSLKKSQTESRIGGLGHERTKSGGLQGGLPRPGMMMGGPRSGIMSSIEKMGSHKGRGD